MRRVRALLIALAVLAGLLVAAAAALYGIARLSWFERRASAWMSETLGRPVQVGELAVGYFPLPSVEVERLAVAADAAGPGPPLIEAARARVVLPWRTVLGVGSSLRRVELQAPQLRLAVDAAGKGNWTGLVERLSALSGEGPAAWSVGALQADGGGIEFLDESGARVTLTGLAVEAQDIRPGRPFPLDLRLAGQSGGYTFHARMDGRAMLDPDGGTYAADELVLDGWLGGDDLPLAGVEWALSAQSLRWDRGAGRAVLRGLGFQGPGIRAAVEAEATGIGTAPAASFEMTSEPFAPRTLGRAFNRELPETADPAALSRAVLRLRGNWNAGGLTIEHLEGELDDSHFSGSLSWPAAGRPPQVRLEVDAVNLDRYLPPTPAGRPAGTSPEAALQAVLSGLQALDVDAQVTIGEARAAGVVAGGLKVVLTPVTMEAKP
jgi:AsmA protein